MAAARLLALGMLAASNLHDDEECTSWAAMGECTANEGYMQRFCAQACADVAVTSSGEPEQCGGWASNGECSRKYARSRGPACWDCVL